MRFGRFIPCAPAKDISQKESESLAIYRQLIDELAEIKRHEENKNWRGYRRFIVDRIIIENEFVRTFVITPSDKRVIPRFEQGQYITISMPIEGIKMPVIRCYSLTNVFDGSMEYHFTVKKIENANGSRGVMSYFLHEKIFKGSIINVAAPMGNFVLDSQSQRPVVLLANGIGITPFMGIIRQIHQLKISRKFTLIYGNSSQNDHVFAEELNNIARENSNFNQIIFYSKPDGSSIKRKFANDDGHYDYVGRIDSKQVVPQIDNYKDCEYYICGSDKMIGEQYAILENLGIDPSHIHYEFFNQGSMVQFLDKDQSQSQTSAQFNVNINGRAITWRQQKGSILECAAQESIEINHGCNIGNCGACATRLNKGSVRYLIKPKAFIESGCILPCVAIPLEDLELG